MRDEDVRVNYRLVFGKTPPPDKNKIARVLVDPIGFRAAKHQAQQLKRNLYRDFAPVVERELQRMARDVSRLAIGISNPSNPPPGSLSIRGRISRHLSDSSPMTIASMTGRWADRNPRYLRQKAATYRTRRWFKNTGELQRALSSSATFQQAYGPVQVKFKQLSGVGQASTLGRGRGGQSKTYLSGRLEVSPFRRLQASDLTPIGQRAEYNQSLISPFTASIEEKLIGQKSKYRPILEPFLAYYLGRKIPNAVFLRLEDSLG